MELEPPCTLHPAVGKIHSARRRWCAVGRAAPRHLQPALTSHGLLDGVKAVAVEQVSKGEGAPG